MKRQQIIRRRAGQVDDVVISGDLFRLERMDDDCWWAAVYRGKDCTAFFLQRTDTGIVAALAEDSIGCADDTKHSARDTDSEKGGERTMGIFKAKGAKKTAGGKAKPAAKKAAVKKRK